MGCTSSSEHISSEQGTSTPPTSPQARSTSTSPGEDKLFKARFIAKNPGSLLKAYIVDENDKLGVGRFGAVTSGKDRESQKSVAIKSIPIKRMEDVDTISQEIEVMSLLSHTAIINLYDTFQDAFNNVFLVMELCVGGTLLQRVQEAGHFTEVNTAKVLFQLFAALQHLHENRICHRDIKPDNVLFWDWHPVEQGFVKLIDFGGAAFFRHGEYLTSKVGSPTYVAPEVLQGKYNETCDLWSTGIVTYVMLSGTPPFTGETDDVILKQAQLGNISMTTPQWSAISEDAKDLVRELCQMRGADRISAEDAFDHQFLVVHRKHGSSSTAF